METISVGRCLGEVLGPIIEANFNMPPDCQSRFSHALDESMLRIRERLGTEIGMETLEVIEQTVQRLQARRKTADLSVAAGVSPSAAV